MWNEEEFKKLQTLQSQAPPSLLMKLKKRIRFLQVGRDLIERQAFAFWIVLNTILRAFLGKRKNIVAPSDKSL